MSAEPVREPAPSATVAGFLAAMAIAAALIGLVWHPLRLIGPAIILSMIAAGMAPKGNRLATAAVFIATACFFTGLLIAVVTQRSLW